MKFVYFGDCASHDTLRFIDKNDYKNIIHVPYQINTQNPILKFLYRFHTSQKVNMFVNLPCKNIWYKFFFKNSFATNPDCFIFAMNRHYFKDIGYFDFLQNHYPQAKFVLYCGDLIESYKYRNFNHSINWYKENFDLIGTYDQREANKYSINYIPPMYIATHININNKMEEKEADIFFVGGNKKRLQKLLLLYEKLSTNRLLCDFYINGVDNSEQKYSNEIKYNKVLDYVDVVNKVQKAKCILEILQKNAASYTLRVMEAIFYNKKLITDNKSMYNAEFYNKDYIYVIDNIKAIDVAEITKFINNGIQVNYDDKVRKAFSLNQFLLNIENLLKK